MVLVMYAKNIRNPEERGAQASREFAYHPAALNEASYEGVGAN